jgi:DNA-binding MarR family transcriptional regulator
MPRGLRPGEPLAENVHMPTRTPPLESTPAGRLREVGLRGVIGYQLAQASVVANALYALAVAQPLGLHRLEFSILMLVRDNPGCTATNLAKALGISTPNMALWLERVAARSLVERRPSEADRRANHLHLTPEGERLAAAAAAAVAQAEADGLSGLSAAERAMLAELLHKTALCRPTPSRG